ncbi:ABC transporter permease [Oceanirhabdus sp. W0125-5]|uniref:ABC transporter permease n=1 Tax=Oceanirhabdus sp. W0125-5 TaxID=2999116 RepID=UPI0022F340A5|nr:ABC transporter permease [Oceanirhabdus sp. W0125-5]WBW97824.1 ABC transporter permease [Oceanirhabdus sp. W0125-5]
MNILKLMRIDFKRYFSNKVLVVIMLVMPVVLATSSVFVLDKVNKNELGIIAIAIVNEDRDNPDTRMILGQIESSKSIKESIKIYHCEYIKGEKMLKNDMISAVFVIPEGFANNLLYGKETSIKLIMNEDKNDIKTMLIRSLSKKSIQVVGYAQNSINIIWDEMKAAGVSKEDRNKATIKVAKSIILNSIGRNRMFNMGNKIIIFEYYISIFLVLFIVLNVYFIFSTIIVDDEVNIKQRLEINNYTNTQYIISKLVSTLIIQLSLYGVPLYLISRYFSIGNSFKLGMTVIILTFFSVELLLVLFKILKKRQWILSAYVISIVIMLFMSGVLPITYGWYTNYVQAITKVDINPMKQGIYLILDGITGENRVEFLGIIRSCIYMISLYTLIIIINKSRYYINRGIGNEKI